MMRVASVVGAGLLVVVGLSACRSESLPSLPLTAPVVEPLVFPPGSTGCAEAISRADFTDVDDRLEALGHVIDALRGESCELGDEAHRLCRSLFLIAATDPLVGVGIGLDAGEVEQLIEWHQWALVEGVAAADLLGDTATAHALGALRRIDSGAALASGPELVDAAAARADPSIIGPLVAAERACLSLPR